MQNFIQKRKISTNYALHLLRYPNTNRIINVTASKIEMSGLVHKARSANFELENAIRVMIMEIHEQIINQIKNDGY